jgi:hypothetical protein
MVNEKLEGLMAKREAMILILDAISRSLVEATEFLAGSPTLGHVLSWQAGLNAKIAEMGMLIREEQTKEALLFLLDDLRSSAETSAETLKESASVVSAGMMVSWEDHLGAWRGKVLEVYPHKVTKKVRNPKAWNDENEHELTRAGTEKDPALYIQIEPLNDESVTALKYLSSVNISYEESATEEVATKDSSAVEDKEESLTTKTKE